MAQILNILLQIQQNIQCTLSLLLYRSIILVNIFLTLQQNIHQEDKMERPIYLNELIRKA